jgi:DNA modification methylase
MLIRGDARRIPLRDQCVQCVVTSPPYWGLRDYGLESSVWGGESECEHEWGDAIQVNATNHTDKRRWNHTRNGRDEEQPIEKRVAWLRTIVDQGNVCVRCGSWRGKLGLEPTPELYVEHLVAVFREIHRVLKADGTVWLNLGDSYANTGGMTGGTGSKDGGAARVARMFTGGYRPLSEGLKQKDLCGIPWRVAFALQADGWYLRSDIIWHKPNPMPESVTDRPTKSHEYLFLLSKQERYVYDAAAIAEPAEFGFSPPVRGDFAASVGGQHASHTVKRGDGGTRNARSVWTIPTQATPLAHFATFPEALVEPCVLAGSRFGDLVLDPFCGTGTVMAVAERLGRRAVGVDLTYQALAKERTAQRGLRFDEETV